MANNEPPATATASPTTIGLPAATIDDPKIKYILDQAATEVEHCRSWPTKIMAFFVTINIGVLTAMIALHNSIEASSSLPPYSKYPVIGLLSFLAFWVGSVLVKNHKNYLKYRDLQVALQRIVLTPKGAGYELPKEWFAASRHRGFNRKTTGFGLYFFMVVLVASFTVTGIYLVL